MGAVSYKVDVQWRCHVDQLLATGVQVHTFPGDSANVDSPLIPEPRVEPPEYSSETAESSPLKSSADTLLQWTVILP